MGTHFIIIEIQFIRVIFFRSDSSAYFNFFFHFCIIGGIEERKCHFGFAIRSRRPTASPCTSTGLQVTVNKFQIPIRETFSRSTSHHAPEFQTCFFENVKNRFGWSKNKQGSFSKPRLYLD